MKIVKVESFLMSYPMPETINLPFWGGLRTIIKRDAMLIKVTADNGLIGYAPGPAHAAAKREIENIIKPFLIGKDPLKWKDFNFNHSLSINKTYHAVEVALMDLHAKFEGCALSEVVGGRKRDTIKLYGSAGMYMAPEEYAEEAAAITAMGFPGYKMRPALGPEEDLRTLKLMREAVGPGVGLMIDAHTWWRMGDKSYSLDTITQLAADMAIYSPAWLEEPLPPEDHDSYAKLRKSSKVPIASGEHEQTLDGFEDMIGKGAVDYVQMDICCQGGYEMGKKIFESTANAGLRFAFHSWGTMLEVLAAAHFGICWPENVVEWLEYPCYSDDEKPGMYPFPLSDEILKGRLEISNGYLQVPDKPGLGIEINEDAIEKYPFIEGPWSFFMLDSPPQTIAVTGDHSVKWVNENESL
jgi:L-alanine-DL-glutamate epimerase-like enolase superfamily enzyme